MVMTIIQKMVPIRDFIHILDLVDIHVIVARALIKNGENQIYNCGYGEGFSIMDVVNEIVQLLDITYQ